MTLSCEISAVELPPDTSSAAPSAMVNIPGGEFVPFFKILDEAKKVQIQPFLIDQYPVTNQQYRDFVNTYPEWRRSRIKRLFAEKNYLQHWTDDLSWDSSIGDISQSPVTYVSWYAAQAYCECQNKRLPTLAEWEWVLVPSYIANETPNDREINEKILSWYARPTPEILPSVGKNRNHYGVYDMLGLVWEWVSDFNMDLITGDSRGSDGKMGSFYCGAASSQATDLVNYAGFMRYAFRNSLKPDFGIANLGFRCARDLTPAPPPATVGEMPELPLSPSPRTQVKTNKKSLKEIPERSLYHLRSTWRDQNNEEVHLSDALDHIQVVTMFFSYCEFACPMIIMDMKALAQGLNPDQIPRVHFSLISFDSERDNPARLQTVSKGHGLPDATWSVLHGNAKAVQELATTLGVKYRKDEKIGFYHNNLISVLDKAGLIAYQDVNTKQGITEIKNHINRLLADGQ